LTTPPQADNDESSKGIESKKSNNSTANYNLQHNNDHAVQKYGVTHNKINMIEKMKHLL